MDKIQFNSVYTEIFEKNGLNRYIKDDIMEKLAELTEIMIAKNDVMNITAIDTVEAIVPLHYADCLMIEPYLPQNFTVLDVGCGGGFPILPLAIVRPDLQITGLDSTEKKVRYVQSTADCIGLHVQTVFGRAEELSHDENYREKFDIVISRAVARMNVLNELCLPFVKQGGQFLAMKGACGSEEAKEALEGCRKLGGSVGHLYKYDLHLLDGYGKRSLICVDKNDATPEGYPRQFGAIKRKPL